MIKNALLWSMLFVSCFFSACAKEYVNDMLKEKDTREIRFSLNSGSGLVMSSARSSVSLAGMQWKIFCFDNQYNYLFDKVGTANDMNNEVNVSVPKGQAYRFLFLLSKDASVLPGLKSGDTYWDMEPYSPKLPLENPMEVLTNQGEPDGTICVTASTSIVSVTLSPRTSKVILQKDPATASEIVVNTITLTDAAASVPYSHIEPQHYNKYENLPQYDKMTYQFVPQEDGVCYMLPVMCAASFGMNATLHVTDPVSGDQNIPVSVPTGFALNTGGGKTYYIDIVTGEDGNISATWATRMAPKTLKLATQNLWGKNASAVIDHFNKIDVDVLCGQECSGFSDAEIVSQGLYVHSHSNNGQGRCSIISRYPFSGTTPNRYGGYIDLGEGIIALVMNCHGAFKPYGPYQLAGIDYGGYPSTTDVEYVIKVNKEVRQEMVNKLLEDFASATTSFISISGDFNEPSWLDWTEKTQLAAMTPYVVKWPTTLALWEGGVKGDAYRTKHPDPVVNPGYTWTPFPGVKDTKDRLDMTLYYLSPNTTVKSCQIIGEDPNTSDIVLSPWIFDHRGVRTEFIYTR